MDDFYIGYRSHMPVSLARRLRWFIALLVFISAGLAAILVSHQAPFSKGVFEYGVQRDFRGVIQLKPYPVLWMYDSSYLLVAPGKFGAEDMLVAYDGQMVTLRGSLIRRDRQTMIEVVPQSLNLLVSGTDQGLEAVEHGFHQFEGEIVDSKCFLGVMKPGESKVHRSCAIRCISGGIPPLWVAHRGGDALGQTYFILVDVKGNPVNQRVLSKIGTPLKIEGRVVQYGDMWVLMSNPETYKDLIQ